MGIYVYAEICMYTYIDIYTYKTFAYIYVYVSQYVNIGLCIRVYVHACINTCIYIYVCTKFRCVWIERIGLRI